VLNITVDVSQIDRAAEAFAKAPDRLKKHLKTAMTDSLHEVLKGAFDRVHYISGTLRRSITSSRPIENMGGGYDGKVGTNLVYARMEEYGFKGPQNVKAHQRTSAFGRPTRPYTVGPFTRNINRPEHPYMRPGLAASRDAIVRYHQQAVSDALSEINSGGSA
jgi:hypothetical protein